MKSSLKTGVLFCCFLCLLSSFSFAANLTRSQVIAKISTADFMQQKIGELFSWTAGYDLNSINRLKLIPNIKQITLLPTRAPSDGRTVIGILTEVDDPKGLKNIEGVRADLSSIGRLPNMMLIDNGRWGDERKSDGVYTLQTSIPQDVVEGDKEIAVAVVNKEGWMALSSTSLSVSNKKIIASARIVPAKVVLSPNTKVVIIEVTLDEAKTEKDAVCKLQANLNALYLDPIKLTKEEGQSAYRGFFVLPPNTPLGKKNIIILLSRNNTIEDFAQIEFEVVKN